jgi:type IV secretion/conjugal transfer VirB4 family ATPase
VSAKVNNILKRLDAGWAIFGEAQREVALRYPESSFRNEIPYLIDEERRSLFQETAHFESAYFLTLVYLPPTDKTGRITGAFVENSGKSKVNYQNYLDNFVAETNRVLDLLKGVLPEVEPLGDEETLTYLHSTVSFKRHRVRVPEVPMYLDAILADTPLIGGLEPRLGKTHVKAISIMSYPGSSLPGILDGLNRLAIEYRWMNRFIPLDKTEALKEIGKYRKRWFSKRKSIAVMLKEIVTGSESVMIDSDAANKAADADAALQEVADDLVSEGFFTPTIVIWDVDIKRLEAKTRAVEKVINGSGFTTITENTNAVEAWLGSIPGHTRANVRRPLINSLNLAHLMPLSAVWAGPEKNKHLNGPVLLHAITSGNTPFRLSLHVGDVGHTMIVGPTGAGKDVLMATIQAQFFRYPDSQIYIFDKGGSSRALTTGVGGDFYDLGSTSDSGLSFQPLAQINIDRERSWASEWVIDLLRSEAVEITPTVKLEVWAALSSLSTAPKEQRTISGLIALLQDNALRQALQTYSIDGPHGYLIDATSDSLSYGSFQAFEMEALMQTPAVVAPILSYLFHRLEQRFDGRPTMLFLNEAWVFFDDPLFAAKIREWLKVLRKANVSVVFATQGLADIEKSSIASALIESCPTGSSYRMPLPARKVLLPSTGGLGLTTVR